MDKRELEGGEFDWFAADRSGNTALFSTPGSGFVPQAVVDGHADHERIANSFPTPHWGSTKVWDDFAVLGLFVYDWAGPEGPYRRVRVPHGKMADELRSRLTGLASMLRLDVEFGDCESISEGEIERSP
jgi:hypothetical protein